MRITELKIFQINPGRKVSFGTGWGKNHVIVKISTDEGIHGIGEAFGTGKAKTTEAALIEFTRWLQGGTHAGLMELAGLLQGLPVPPGYRYDVSAERRRAGAVGYLREGLRAAGVKMLGGPVRDRIRLYASGYLAQPRHFDIEGLPLVEACRATVEAGFTAIKITPQPDDWETKTPGQVLRDSIERVRSVREALGEDIDICLDYHGRNLSPTEAIKLARAIEPYHPLFLEEPALTENPDSLVEIKSKTTIPIAAGERCISRDRLREILEKKAVHILQPEPVANGGILETVKWAAMAELHHILMAPHHACSALALVTCAHIDACLTNFLIQECNVDLGSPFTREIFNNLPVIKDGYLELPEGPGLGIELNEEAALNYQYKPYDRPVLVREDGSIGLE